MHSLWLPGGLAPPCRVISSGRKSLYNRHTASTEAYSVKMAALFSVSLHDGSPLGDSSPSHCACVILRHCRLLSTVKPRMRHNDRSVFNHGEKRRKPVFLKHYHLFTNKVDVVTVDKTDEVEDQKVSPQFRFIC